MFSRTNLLSIVDRLVKKSETKNSAVVSKKQVSLTEKIGFRRKAQAVQPGYTANLQESSGRLRRGLRFLLAFFVLNNLRTHRFRQNRFPYCCQTFTHRFASRKREDLLRNAMSQCVHGHFALFVLAWKPLAASRILSLGCSLRQTTTHIVIIFTSNHRSQFLRVFSDKEFSMRTAQKVGACQDPHKDAKPAVCCLTEDAYRRMQSGTTRQKDCFALTDHHVLSFQCAQPF